MLGVNLTVDKYVIEVVDNHLSHYYIMRYNNDDFSYLYTKNYHKSYNVPLYYYDTYKDANDAISNFNIDIKKYPIVKVSKVEKEC